MNYFSNNIHRDGGKIYVYPGVTVKIASSAVIELHGDLHLGIRSKIHSNKRSRLVMSPFSRICINNNCSILEDFDIQLLNKGIFTVDNFHANIGLEISCGNQIRLLGEVTAGRHVRIKDFNGHDVSYHGYPYSKAIIIEDHVWICTGSTINAGSYVENGVVIADNTNVIGRIPSCSFVQGNPGLVVANNITFKI